MSTSTPDEHEGTADGDVPWNPMVEYLGSLRTQQQDANATYVHEARREFLRSLRATAPWFPAESELHAPTLLDRLADDLASGQLRPRLIFLTGDAGDGKTAFCATLARALGHHDELEIKTVLGRWHVIKDASEIDEDDLAQDVALQLQPSAHTTLVVAINEGRLRRLFRLLKSDGEQVWREVVAPALDTWLESDGATALDAAMKTRGVMVLNFRHRFHVRTVAPSLLARWTPASLWEDSPACGSCPARPRCPILANVKDLRAPEVQGRVSDVLAWAHFAGQRLPFRRLQAVLALATTGGLRCADVVAGALRGERSARLLRHRFYNALFLREVQRDQFEIRPEPIASAFAAADDERFVDPERDQTIDELLRTPPVDGEPSLLNGLEWEAAEELRASLAPSAPPESVARLTADLAHVVRSLRRCLQLRQGPPRRASWRTTLARLEAAAASEKGGHDLRGDVIEGINRLHRIQGSKRDRITDHQIDPAAFRTASRQMLELSLGTEFEARLVRGPTLPQMVQPYLESTPGEIFLEAIPRGGSWASTGGQEPARLRLDARLVDILHRVREGYDSWQSLGAHRRDLARFHARLMALAAALHEPEMTLRIGARRYSVSSTGGTLRFEGQE